MTVTKLHQREVTWEGEGAPVDGETGAHRIGLGCLYVDVLTGNTYANIGTMGIPEFVAVGGGGGGTPGGADTQVQFNDGNAFAGDAGLTYDKAGNVLSVSDAIAFGPSPASTGAIRLSLDNAVESRNYAGDADIQQIKPSSFVNGGNHYNSLLIGDRYLYDPDYNQMLIGFNGGFFVAAGDTSRAAYDGDNVFSHNYVTVQANSIQLTDNSGGQLFMAFNSANVLQLTLKGLPTSDPAAAGRVYSMDAAGVGAELAAGSRYLLVSDGP